MKKWLFAPILAAAVLFSLPAATVSFLVVETGLPEGSARPESSSLWESGMMDAFFDAGHIVSNAPILRLDGFVKNPAPQPLPRELRRELDDARLGGADFFVVVLLDYHDNPVQKPAEIMLQVFRVSSGQLVYASSFGGYTGVKMEEEFQSVKKSAGKILPQLRVKG
jgi:hypothetical protein